MNRPIKFRAFSEKDKAFLYSDQAKTVDPMSYFWNAVHVLKLPVQQFTGLLDKNGKEIYEGDVVKVYDENRGETAEDNYLCTQQIKWSGAGYFCDEDTGEFCPALNSEEISMEVIGNIYENPELISPNK